MTRSNLDSLRSHLARLATMISAACLISAAVSCGAPVGPAAAGDDAQPILYHAADVGPFANVTANGTGCPAGTWTAAVSEDGTTFAITFDAFEASVAPGSAISVKDCTLGIQLADDPHRQYAVESIAYEGQAALGAGVRTTVSANYYFQGTPAEHQELTTDFTGPFNQSFNFFDAPVLEELGWSQCGVQRDLNVTARIVLRNAPGASSSGTVGLNSVEGDSQLSVRVVSRGC